MLFLGTSLSPAAMSPGEQPAFVSRPDPPTDMNQLVERYKSSPSWLKALVLLGIAYLAHRIWTKITRTRRELQAASWILSQRRRAGIPDSDKRPFKIAKAAVDAGRKGSGRQGTPAPPSPPPSTIHPPALRPQPNLLSPPSPAPSNSVETIKSIGDHQDHISVASNASNPTHRTSTKDDQVHSPSSPKDPLNNPKPSSSLKPNQSSSITSDQPIIGRSLQKRVAPLSTDGSDVDVPEVEEENSTARNRKKAKTQKTPTTSQPVDTEPALPGNLADHPSPRKPNSDASSPRKIQLRKKRILSDCVGDLDNDRAARIKKGRSEKPSALTHPLSPTEGTCSEAHVSMQVEEDGEDDDEDEDDGQVEDEQVDGDEEREEKDELDEAKKESDAERYMTTDNGQKKKLVQIRLNTPESNYSPEEGATEYRWVTRRQFRDLGQRGMLLMDDDEWEGDSMTSANSIESSSMNHLSTPSKQTTSIIMERGPIWSIEGKKSATKKSPLSTSDLSPKPHHSVSRPRNSLGRIRLSLPPPPASPLHRSRSRLLSPLRPLNP